MKKRLKKLIPLLALIVAVNSLSETIVFAASATDAVEAQALVEDDAAIEITETTEAPAEEETEAPAEEVPEEPSEEETEEPSVDEPDVPAEEEDPEEAEVPSEETPEEPSEDVEDETEVTEEEEILEEEIEEELETEQEEADAIKISGYPEAVIDPEKPFIGRIYKEDYTFEVYYPDDGTGTLQVSVDSINEDASNLIIDIPKYVNFDGNGYRVEFNGYSIASKAVDPSKIKELRFPEDMRTLYCNLFDYNAGNYSSLKDLGYDTGTGAGLYVPDSTAVVKSIPDFISKNYVNGAYYAGKCLVRVNPNYAGAFTVKEGTVCVLASAFEGCSKITKVTLPSSVEYIGVRAFANSSVTEINLPQSLKPANSSGYSIETLTFYNCTKLKKINIQSTEDLVIGYAAFVNCSALTGFDFTRVSRIDGLSFFKAFNAKSPVTVDLTNAVLMNSPDMFAYAAVKKVIFGAQSFIPDEMFRNDTCLQDIVWGDVKYIYMGAFSGCTKLTKDVLGDPDCKVVSVNYRAFAKTGMTTVTWRENMSVSGAAFAESTKINTVNLHVGSNGLSCHFLAAFNEPGSQNYMTDTYMSKDKVKGLPAKTKTLVTVKTLNIWGRDNYGNTTNLCLQPYLETVNYMDSVTSIGSNEFAFCTSLKKVTFADPAALQSIGDRAFETCPSLREFPFAKLSGLKSIGYYAFQLVNICKAADGTNQTFTVDALAKNKSALKNVGLLNIDLSGCTSLTSIGYSAFYNQMNAKKIVIPENVTSISSGTFVGTASVTELVVDARIATDGVLNSNLIGYFLNKYSDSKKQQWNCENSTIKTVHLNNVESLNSGLFTNFAALENVYISGTIKDLPANTFIYCRKLKNVSLPDGLETIGENAFMYCDSMTTLKLPDSVYKIDMNAFHKCTKLKSITMSGVENIGYAAFIGDTALQSVTGMHIYTIGASAFMDCKSLKTVNAPFVRSIDYGAFIGCPKLEKVTTTGWLEHVGRAAFQGTALKEADIIGYCTYEPAVYADCKKLQTVKVEPGALAISDFMFANDTAIKSVTMYPSSISRIGWGAFKNAIAKNSKVVINLPDTLNTIEDDAFALSGVAHLNFNSNPKILTEHEGCPENSVNDLLPIPASVKIVQSKDLIEWMGSTSTWVQAYVDEFAPTAKVYNQAYKIRFDDDIYYDMSNPNQTMIYDPSDPKMTAITLQKPTRPGYTFGGWYMFNEAGTKVNVSKITNKFSGDLYLYSKWTPIKYKVVFEKNTTLLKTYSMPGKTLTYDDYVSVPTPTYTTDPLIHLEFIGWNTEKDGSGIMYYKDSALYKVTTRSGATVKLYAQWDVSYG